MAVKKVITDIESLVYDIGGRFDAVKANMGITTSKKALIELLYGHVKRAIENSTVCVHEDEPPKCQHKWRDFDWYLEYSCSNTAFNYEIIEPYVCIHCGERKNVTLESGRIYLTNGENEKHICRKFMETYPKLKPKPIVQDEINDAILVDREYLRIADYLRGNTDIDKKIELK